MRNENPRSHKLNEMYPTEIAPLNNAHLPRTWSGQTFIRKRRELSYKWFKVAPVSSNNASLGFLNPATQARVGQACEQNDANTLLGNLGSYKRVILELTPAQMRDYPALVSVRAYILGARKRVVLCIRYV